MAGTKITRSADVATARTALTDVTPAPNLNTKADGVRCGSIFKAVLQGARTARLDGPNEGYRRVRLLVLEDDPRMAELVAGVLERAGFVVDKAPNAGAARRRWANTRLNWRAKRLQY